MVTQLPHPGTRAPLSRTVLRTAAAAALWLATLACLAMATADAQEATIYFLTAKAGQQDVGGSLFKTLAANHGPLRDAKTVTREGFDFDIYAVTRHHYGLAIGIDLMDYDQTFHFQGLSGVQTPEQLRLQARSILYTLMGFLRFGDFLPFIGLGTGTYYVHYNEKVSGLSFADAAADVFAYRAGFRWLMVGRWGLLVEVGQIDAPLRVLSNNVSSTLDLGGGFYNVGLSYVW